MKIKTCTILFILISFFSSAAEWYQAIDLVNIRSGPGKSYPVVGTIAKYDSVIIDSIVQEYEWGQVIANNKIKGYAAMQYLTTEFEYPSKTKTINKNSKADDSKPENNNETNTFSSIVGALLLGAYCIYIFLKRSSKSSQNSPKKNQKSDYPSSEKKIFKEQDEITEVRLDSNWFRVYDKKGKQLSVKGKHSKEQLLGYSNKLIVIQDGSWYRIYNPQFKQIAVKGVQSKDKFIGVTGNSITIQDGSWIRTYNEIFKQINIRAAH